MRMTWMIASPPSPVVTTGEPTDESLRLMVENQLFLVPVLDPPHRETRLFFFLSSARLLSSNWPYSS